MGVGDARVLDGYVLDGVIVAAAYGADGETVAAGTSAVGEEDVLNKIISASAPYLFKCLFGKQDITYLPRINSQTIVLIPHNRIYNLDPRTFPNIERIGIMSTLRISIRIIDRDISQDQPIRLDTKHMNRGVLDRDAADTRRVEVMRVEELGLRHAVVAALAVPPAGSVAV